MTIRRRFLLASSLVRLVQRQRGGLRHIEGYFPERPDRSALVRLEENKGLLILRMAGPDGEVEEQTEVPIAHAHALLDVCAGEIAYDRTKLRIGDRVALIDQVIHPRDVQLVTIEFGTGGEAKDFRPLAWFGPEVTADTRYTNKGIALGRLTDSPDIPLSNAALDGLLDALENRFPNQPQTHLRRPAANQAGAARAKPGQAQAYGQSNKANLDEIEAAIMREMELTLQNKRS
jgi:CYTH domain-containing protein